MLDKSTYGARILLLLSLAISIGIFFIVSHEEDIRYSDKFHSKASSFERTFSEQLEKSFTNLYSIQAFYKNSGDISFSEFAGFSKILLERSKFIAALEWIPRVEGSERLEYVERIRSQGYVDFELQEKDANGNMRLAAERDFYYPVYYVEPYANNKAAHGFDLASHSGRFEAIRYAFSVKGISCTEPIQLVQDTEKTAAVLVFLPVDVDSLILAVLRIEDVFKFTMSQLGTKDLLVDITDASDGRADKVIGYDASLVGNKSLDYRYDVNMGGRNWQVQIVPSGELSITSFRWAVLAVLLIFSLILYSYLIQQVYKNQRIEEVVVLRTADLEEARKVAMEASRSKSDFLANMSHEIRTPMTSILGYIDMLKESKNMTDSEDLEALEVVERNGMHLLSIINDILDLSKIEVGKMEIEMIGFNLYKSIEDIHKLLRAKAETKGLHFGVNCHFPIPKMLVLDPIRLKQVLINILGNSMKFTNTGEVTLDVKWDQVTSEISFIICDTGIGMDKNQIKKMFDEFSQADISTTRKYGGTGLGLAITKRLTELMGGEIDVQSELTVGTTFTVSFKAKIIDGNLLNTAPQVEQAEVKFEADMLSGNVLLVDDNITNLTLVSKILKKMDLSVECCMNGKEAIDILDQENEFNIVLMDVQMPVMDGLAATAALREKGFTKPIIALTANNMKGDREVCIDAGYTDYTPKPINKKDLRAKLKMHL